MWKVTLQLPRVLKIRATFIFMITSANVYQFSFFFTVKFRKDLRKEKEMKLPPPSNMVPHYLAKRKGQLYSLTFILARIICFMSSDICFTSFLFVYFFFFLIILTSLWRYCSILFVALLIPSSYEDKRWHTIEQRTFTSQNTHMCQRRTF